ncbi:MAG: hypothetical protein HY360_15950 [Verrucomicrobia bacterium]|nr:hypothetical protein [Verrucomicrobiota bacterium]
MKSPSKPRIIYNDDSCTLRTAPPPHTVETIAYALDYLKGTQVDCLCGCVGEQQLAYSWPSKAFESYYNAALDYLAGGKERDYHTEQLRCQPARV